MCNSLIKHSDPEHVKIMRAVTGFGIQGNKSRVQQSGLGGGYQRLLRGQQCQGKAGLEEGSEGMAEDGGRRGLGAAKTPGAARTAVPRAQLAWGQAECLSWGTAGVWMVPVETALHGEVLPGVILTRNCKG